MQFLWKIFEELEIIIELYRRIEVFFFGWGLVRVTFQPVHHSVAKRPASKFFCTLPAAPLCSSVYRCDVVNFLLLFSNLVFGLLFCSNNGIDTGKSGR